MQSFFFFFFYFPSPFVLHSPFEGTLWAIAGSALPYDHDGFSHPPDTLPSAFPLVLSLGMSRRQVPADHREILSFVLDLLIVKVSSSSLLEC